MCIFLNKLEIPLSMALEPPSKSIERAKVNHVLKQWQIFQRQAVLLPIKPGELLTHRSR